MTDGLASVLHLLLGAPGSHNVFLSHTGVTGVCLYGITGKRPSGP